MLALIKKATIGLLGAGGIAMYSVAAIRPEPFLWMFTIMVILFSVFCSMVLMFVAIEVWVAYSAAFVFVKHYSSNPIVEYKSRMLRKMLVAVHDDARGFADSLSDDVEKVNARMKSAMAGSAFIAVYLGSLYVTYVLFSG